MNPDLRDFLKTIENEERENTLRISKKVRLKYEIPSYAMELQRKNKTPLLIFENVENSDLHVVANGFASRKRFALALGASEDTLVKEWLQRSKSEKEPVELNSGPIKEIALTGEKIDLHKLPIITHFTGEPGPYITSGIIIAKHPHTKIRNASFHRLQLKGKRTLGTSLHSRRHLWEYQRIAEEEGKPLEVAIVIGAHPLFSFGAGLWKGPNEKDEFKIVGGFMKTPLEIVKCETVDLEVPANAEIVLEGKILPNVRKDEGPFGEFTGYSSKNSTRHLIEVTAISMRKDAVYQEIIPGMSAEHTLLLGIPQECRILEKLREVVPTTKAVSYPLSGACRFHCYVSITKTAEGQPATAIFSALAEDLSLKLVIVVDEDIDVYNEREVLWALATRFQADKDIYMASRCMGALLDPSSKEGLTAKMGIDATKPLTGWKAERCNIAADVSQAVRKELGF